MTEVIYVGGVARKLKKNFNRFKLGTVDMTKTVNGITGPALGQLDLAYGGLSKRIPTKYDEPIL